MAHSPLGAFLICRVSGLSPSYFLELLSGNSSSQLWTAGAQMETELECVLRRNSTSLAAEKHPSPINSAHQLCATFPSPITTSWRVIDLQGLAQGHRVQSSHLKPAAATTATGHSPLPELEQNGARVPGLQFFPLRRVTLPTHSSSDPCMLTPLLLR